MKKTTFLWYLLGFFVIIFNIYFFLLKGFDQPTSVWISYASIHIAYLMLLLTPFFVRKGSNSVDYGPPLFVITASYFFFAFTIGVVFIILSPETYTLALLVQITITAFFAVLLLNNLIYNDHTADNIERHEGELKYVKKSSSKLNALLQQTSDIKILKEIEKAYDLIHSSQVKSSYNIKLVEQAVIDEIDNLEKALKQRNLENIQLIVDKIYNLANERNRQLNLLN